MRRPMVAGNWKMHGSRAENATLVDALVETGDGLACEIVVCAPFVYLWEVGRHLKDSPIALGAQDVCAEAQGAFTGEVSAAMLRDVGCTHVIVGHSERRVVGTRAVQLPVAGDHRSTHRDVLKGDPPWVTKGAEG